MKLFQTSDGRPHGLRVVGVILLFGLPFGCNPFVRIDPLCWTHIMFIAGWWLWAGGKRYPATWAEWAQPRQLLGLVLVLLGLAAPEFYMH